MDIAWLCKGWFFYFTLLVGLFSISVFIIGFLDGFFIIKSGKKGLLKKELVKRFEDPIFGLVGYQSIIISVMFIIKKLDIDIIDDLNKLDGAAPFVIIFGILLLILLVTIINIVFLFIGFILGLVINAIVMPFIRLIKRN